MTKIFNAINVTYNTGHTQCCQILLPHAEGADVLALAQAYFDAKYGTGVYGSTITSAVSVEQDRGMFKVEYARTAEEQALWG